MQARSVFSRVIVVVLDSVGIGALPDAHEYGDMQAATLQHIAQAVSGLGLPHLNKLGLGRIASIEGLAQVEYPMGWYGKMAERSVGKDTMTGHWEMMGIDILKPFGMYPKGFPTEIIQAFSDLTGRGVLGNLPASGTQIIEDLGREHIKTGKWIVYTSADSVFQLAAHEEVIPLAELYAACEQARNLLDAYRIGRVIARPFVGVPGSFVRTSHRHDYTMVPETASVLTTLVESGLDVVGLGKIDDIFAGRGLTRSIRTQNNQDGMHKLFDVLNEQRTGLVFLNLVDFDMQYGHRRDPRGYARALEDFDVRLGELCPRLDRDDLLIITADHGCDPTFMIHTDHTREYVPVLVWTPRLSKGGDLGVRNTFADLGATVAHALGVEWTGSGVSFFSLFST